MSYISGQIFCYCYRKELLITYALQSLPANRGLHGHCPAGPLSHRRLVDPPTSQLHGLQPDIDVNYGTVKLLNCHFKHTDECTFDPRNNL